MVKLLSQLNEVPGHCGEGKIVMLTAGLDVFADQAPAFSESARSASLEHHAARRFLAGRRLLRNVLSRLMDCSPQDIEIETDEAGKPRLSAGSYHFSIAHSGDAVGVAVAESPLGIDLEWERPVDAPGLARRFFSPDEAALLVGESPASLFFTLWTCREAAVKGDGRGLARLLSITRTRSLPVAPEGIVEVLIGGDSWSSLHWREDDGLHGAVAFRTVPSAISWCDLRGKAIL